jgi:hypothetical protein
MLELPERPEDMIQATLNDDVFAIYKELAAGAGIHLTEKEARKRFDSLIKGNVKESIYAAGESLNSLREQIRQIKNELEISKSLIRAIKDEGLLNDVRGECNSIVDDYCRKFNNISREYEEKIDKLIKEKEKQEKLNKPFENAVSGLLDILNEKNVPPEQIGEIVSAYITSVGYLYWQQGTQRQKDESKVANKYRTRQIEI